MRRKSVLIVILVLVLSIGGCKSAGKRSAEIISNGMNPEETQTTTNEASNSESGLSIFKTNDREAVFSIRSNALTENINGGNEAKESNLVYSWKIYFGDFCADATIMYEEGKDSYNTGDIKCSLGFLKKEGTDGFSTWEIKSLEYTVSGNQLDINVSLPTEEELQVLEGADISDLAAFTFNDATEYKYSEYDKGMEKLSLLFDQAIITNQGTEAGQEQTSSADIFPEQVYEAGFQKGDLDAVWFAPSTENYVLYDKSKTDPNGITGLDQKILFVFNNGGNLKEGYVREGYINGMEAGDQGMVPVYADSETMKSILADRLAQGFVQGSEGALNESEANVSDSFLYYRLKQTTIKAINTESASRGYLTDLAWAQADPSAMIDTMAEIIYTENSAAQLYMSEMNLLASTPVAENYCAQEDFQYLDDTELITDDYYITESTESTDIYFFDESGNCIKECRYLDISDPATYTAAMKGGYTKVGDSATLVYTEWSGSSENNKEGILLNFKITLNDGSYSSFQQSMTDNGYAFYMSKPWME